jgi:hypothetical protein
MLLCDFSEGYAVFEVRLEEVEALEGLRSCGLG